MKRSLIGRGRPPKWGEAQEAMLRAQYPHMSTKIVAVMLGLSPERVYSLAAHRGLKKTDDYLASPEAFRFRRGQHVGKAYQFPKGHVPANKGLRRPGWHSGRMKETQFKKGQKNHNVMPLFSTRLVDGYLYIKVAEVMYVPYTVNWLPLHILTWERANGPLPKGHCIKFKDGNRLNTELENLELISRADNMRRNSLHNLPKPLAEIIQLRGAINRQINKRIRNGRPAKQ